MQSEDVQTRLWVQLVSWERIIPPELRENYNLLNTPLLFKERSMNPVWEFDMLVDGAIGPRAREV